LRGSKTLSGATKEPLSIVEKKCGEEHDRTARILNMLALVYCDGWVFGEAIPLEEVQPDRNKIPPSRQSPVCLRVSCSGLIDGGRRTRVPSFRRSAR